MAPVLNNSTMCYWPAVCLKMRLTWYKSSDLKHSIVAIKYRHANHVWLVSYIYQLIWAEAPADGEWWWLSSLQPLPSPAPWGSPYHWAHFSANSPCLRASKAPFGGNAHRCNLACHSTVACPERCRKLQQSADVGNFPPKEYIFLQTVRIMNDACRTSQSVYHMPRYKYARVCVCVFACITRPVLPPVHSAEHTTNTN